MILGAARYPSAGPPFSDPKLQATYDAEWRKLASNVLIPESTAKDLVATVINSALAAGESAIPMIERRVQTAVEAKIPKIEQKVRAAAEGSVKPLLLGAAAVVGLAGISYGIYRAAR